MKRLLFLTFFLLFGLSAIAQSLTGQCFQVDSISHISEDVLGPWDDIHDTCIVYVKTDIFRMSAPFATKTLQMVEFRGGFIVPEATDTVLTYDVTISLSEVCFITERKALYLNGSVNINEAYQGLLFSCPRSEE